MLKTFRKISPDQHSAFTEYMSTMGLFNSDVTGSTDLHTDFDDFYDTALLRLEKYYP